jgi:hypothetical protein
LPLKFFCWIFPLTEGKGLVKSVWDFSCATLISAVSLTLLKSFQRCQCRRRNRFSSVNDTAEIVSAVLLTPLKFGKKFCS